MEEKMDKFEQIRGNYYSAFSLRVSEDIMEAIKEIAIRNKRSINKEIEFALERYIEENKLKA